MIILFLKIYIESRGLLLNFDFENLDFYLKENLNEFRYKHTLRVVEMGALLCEKFSYKNSFNVKLACYLHDAGKNFPSDEIKKIVLNEGYFLNDFQMKNIHVYHGVASMVIARDVFDVHDQEVLNAIKFHVMGRENMTFLDKIVFLADFFEFGRDFDRVNESREAALVELNINKSMLLAYDSIIKELIFYKKYIHEDTIKARNFILKELSF